MRSDMRQGTCGDHAAAVGSVRWGVAFEASHLIEGDVR